MYQLFICFRFINLLITFHNCLLHIPSQLSHRIRRIYDSHIHWILFCWTVFIIKLIRQEKRCIYSFNDYLINKLFSIDYCLYNLRLILFFIIPFIAILISPISIPTGIYFRIVVMIMLIIKLFRFTFSRFMLRRISQTCS